MSRLLYDFGISVYWAFAQFISHFNQKARLFIQGRKNQPDHDWNPGGNKVVWIHTASLGEFEQGRPIIEHLKAEQKYISILLTFFSPSGYEVRKNYEYADKVMYLPKDTKRNSKEFLESYKPDLAIMIKYEFWYHFINQANANGIPIILASGIFRKDQIFFKPYGGFFRSILLKLNHLFVQNEESSYLLNDIEIKEVSISGDTRFDRVIEIESKKRSIPEIETFKKGHKLIVIGSAWEEDMKVLNQLINENPFNYKIIIAPHEVGESFIHRVTKGIEKQFQLFSKYKDEGSNSDILIIDNIGMLSSLYAYADIAYVGGAFGKGLNNILEAAVYGIPIFFGNKNYLKYQEAVDLKAKKGAFPIGSYQELLSIIEEMDKSNTYQSIGKVCQKYVMDRSGATKRILSFIEEQKWIS